MTRQGSRGMDGGTASTELRLFVHRADMLVVRFAELEIAQRRVQISSAPPAVKGTFTKRNATSTRRRASCGS